MHLAKTRQRQSKPTRHCLFSTRKRKERYYNLLHFLSITSQDKNKTTKHKTDANTDQQTYYYDAGILGVEIVHFLSAILILFIFLHLYLPTSVVPSDGGSLQAIVVFLGYLKTEADNIKIIKISCIY